MRHIRARRRFKLILFFFLIVCVVLFLETSIEAYVPQLKHLAESRIERALDDKVSISIGSVEGGIFRPFVFNDIRIKNKKRFAFFSSLAISSIKTNYRVWNVFIKRKNSSLISNLFPEDSKIDLEFVSRNEDASGFVRAEKGVSGLGLKGWLKILNKHKIDFDADIKENSFDVEMRPVTGVFKAHGTIPDDESLIINFKADHIRLRGFDIVCEGILKNKIKLFPGDSRKNCLEGELDAGNVIINYKPFLDIKSVYTISDNLLNISELSLGNSFAISGNVLLKKPYNMDMKLAANNVSIAWLMSTLGAKEGTLMISGTMNGKLALKGDMKNLKSNTHLEIRKGTLTTLDFDFLSADLKGDGPLVRIEDSRIARQSGYFALAGDMDLRRLGKNNFFENIRMASDDKAITWDEWDTKDVQGMQEVRMTKKISEDINIDFKKFVADTKIDESSRCSDEVRLEYKLNPNERLKMMVGQDNDFFGFEHKDSF